ncbi:MAG: tRNA (guanine37-N1)-methyltransferase [Halieaceae bacterium]|jgi:tRNA (guanine37-N1)-methyltransferase
MRAVVVTLFPEMMGAVTESGVTGRAVRDGLLAVDTVNPRDFTRDRHRSVDDRPYGGGPGMVMRPEPLVAALAEARSRAGGAEALVLHLSPQGRRFDHAVARELSHCPNLVLLAGRYEGIDERVIGAAVDGELSIGDYVLSGGELAAMVVIDAIARLLPGVLGHEDSAAEDSFEHGLLDCPHYTRPEHFAGRDVPAVLLSGDHEAIRRWRLQQSLGRTWERRPELLEQRSLTAEERDLLEAYRKQ